MTYILCMMIIILGVVNVNSKMHFFENLKMYNY